MALVFFDGAEFDFQQIVSAVLCLFNNSMSFYINIQRWNSSIKGQR
jgi:hypothetical protein